MTNHAVLDPQVHRALRIDARKSVIGLGRNTMLSMVVPSEFPVLASDYPLLFQRSPSSGRLQAVAVFGFEAQENLYLTEEGWDAPVLPLAIAVEPFLIAAPAPGQHSGRVALDLDDPRVLSPEDAGHGEALFGADGTPSPFLRQQIDRLTQLDRGHHQARSFYEALEDYELIEPLTVSSTFEDGLSRDLVGFHTIAEEAVERIDQTTRDWLEERGYWRAITAAAASLSTFPALAARRNARLTHA
ncbi:SapC family protein [Altericroceibacterium endophyticum]|uniref:Multidrug transporter n=1 Tax=Altericroceibacterium endophyticum TaxID=1808508 RepID=A0A6I4T7J4_9SPHN|nr:SapC family protein [Altericroceibacterium endophyticum]MXO67124.1 multidrug transporter [Altericroceibacterium endophyticum]